MKVYLASVDTAPHDSYELYYDYILCTFITYYKTRGIDRFMLCVDLMNKKKGALLDSGLFSLLFGSEQGTVHDLTTALEYFRFYIESILKTGYKKTVIECDFQLILGSEITWEFRKKMSTVLDNEIMHVYHLKDENPDKLIAYSNYIAVAIPGLKMLVGRKECIKIITYITAKCFNKGKRVHLLGCTDRDIMRKFHGIVESCDSISYRAMTAYNRPPVWANNQNFNINKMYLNFENQQELSNLLKAVEVYTYYKENLL